MDLLMCSEDMMPETPEGVIQGPGNMSEILARRQLSCDLKFSNDEPGPLGHTDRNLLDPRMLHHMLKMEEVLHEQLSPIMFTYLQDQVTPRMRQDTLCWLYEVCEAEGYPEEVFLRTCSYIDRILSVYTLVPNQLQLLGVVCISISLKFHGINFKMDKLLYYTANSVPKNLISDWELMVLYGLKWDMATIIPTDFIQMFEAILPSSWFEDKVMHQQVSAYLSLCATDCSFMLHTPSTIAVASLSVAISHLISKEVGEEVLERFHQLTHIDKDVIRSVMEKIQIKLAQSIIPEENLTTDCDPGLNNNNKVINKHNVIQFHNDEPMTLDKIEELCQAETPTDVNDLFF
ncbi:G1/S-specific cyclin-D1 [Folsomia candida]|uniref:G1/S-specific cyclin-D1 n=1 Tax=Folsomia candida TaxID=158441 RepID=A0A226E7W5_FOLCA|nr:G1/S-specific cyclin-D1 [Folsomia candida]